MIKDSAAKRPSVSSHNRLFGDTDRVPPTPKTYNKSSIPIGKDDPDAPKLTNGNGTSNGNGNGVVPENGNANGSNGHTNGSRGK